MTTTDPRSEKVAVVADALLLGSLATLRARGYGVMQLPPSEVSQETADAWIVQTAEQVAEYRRNGYEVVLLDDGSWAGPLTAALASHGIGPLPVADLG